MAGLILCVFSLDVNRLSALAHGQNAHDAKLARRLLKILDRPHWLLITLLIWNDIALEMMPLMLNMVLNPFVAIFTCVAITLVFSEIIPQAIFIHHAFTLSARLAPFIYLLMWVSSPIAWPIGKLLDIIVGDKEAVFFQRRDLRELIRYQEQLYKRKRHDERSDDRSEPEDGEEDLTKEEIAIMLNVLSLSESTARDMLQAPMSSMYRLHVDAVISEAVVETVFMNGYNFVPVYEDVSDPCNVTCVLMTKSLVLLVFRSEGENIQVKDLPLIPLQRFSGDTLGSEMYVTLQSLSPSIAAITDNSSGSVLGLLTLRNVTELVHQTTFKAEMDPRNQSPMQMIMRSWKIYGRGDGSIDVNRQHSSLHDSFARWSPIPPWDRRDHAGRETQVPQMSNAVRLTSPGRSRSADYAELL